MVLYNRLLRKEIPLHAEIYPKELWCSLGLYFLDYQLDKLELAYFFRGFKNATMFSAMVTKAKANAATLTAPIVSSIAA